MLTLYFGLPGCGKTTYAVYRMLLEQDKINRGVSCYDFILTNIQCNIPGVRYAETLDWLGSIAVRRCLIVWDESIVDFNSRKFKSFKDEWVYGFTQHRHYFQDWLFLSQRYDGLDAIIRALTEKIFYIHKGKFNKGISYITPVKFGIHIPKEIDSFNQGQIIQGHYQGNIIDRLCQEKIPRSLIYPYFDSFIETRKLQELEANYFPLMENLKK